MRWCPAGGWQEPAARAGGQVACGAVSLPAAQPSQSRGLSTGGMGAKASLPIEAVDGFSSEEVGP
jgi:hypothetical protein